MTRPSSPPPPRSAEIDRLAALVLPEPAPEIVPLPEAGPERAAEIGRRMAEIDLADAATILHFGARAQSELQAVSQAMLADVRNKEAGPAGETLRRMVATLRGFAPDEGRLRRGRSLWDRVRGRAAPLATFLARYEDVQAQVDAIAADLDRQAHGLLKDVKALDGLYAQTLAFHEELGLYIAAGEARLAAIAAQELPQAERAAAGAEGTLAAQALRDLRAARDDLERRVHDLRLTRQVTMQALPSIRLVQENDKSLVARINSVLVNTVPLWETQLAQAVTIQRSAEAADAVRAAGDLTNALLQGNAERLRSANAAVRTEMERGVFDIGAVRAANAALVATIEDSLRIADEGKARRAAAQGELAAMERDLRRALAAAASRAPGARPDGQNLAQR